QEYQATRNAESFRLLFVRHRREVLARSYRICRNPFDAEDIAQAVFLKTLLTIDQYQPREGGAFRFWLYKIAHDLSVNYISSAAVRHEKAGGDLPEIAVQPEHLRDTSFRNALPDLIIRLSVPQRICVKMFYLEGFSAKEVVRQTGFTEREVKTHIQNGK